MHHNLPTSQDHLIVLYTVDNLCKGRNGRLALDFLNVIAHTSTTLHSQRLLMSHCLLALAKVFYGLKTREKTVLRDGARLYGQGLKKLRDFLDGFDSDHSSITMEIIVSVLALSMTEVCTYSFRFQTKKTRKHV